MYSRQVDGICLLTNPNARLRERSMDLPSKQSLWTQWLAGGKKAQNTKGIGELAGVRINKPIQVLPDI